MVSGLVLLIVALVLFVLAGFSVSAREMQLGWFGAAFAVLAVLVGRGAL